ncbi:class I SAM-dependent methyltransferase [Halobellus ruber]|uniref:Methyltransferase domain-containing protein n=1 Tax=Halobellus ruber TaxID=2761102 RepID=A0A7J9SG12_9EURY|nr:methyltransferase domain-containing protein [Halobellus ruber]MBB6644917.1 methyltransferase domain-containing protein [Halobellus ruber]
MSDAEPELTEAQRVEALWSRVPYHQYARVVAPAAAHLVDAADVTADDSVLDVACGTGNVAITAARRGADVTGIDLNGDMLEWAQENADLIDAEIAFERGDATDLPVGGGYDVVLSSFGHHLTSDPVTATEELVRAADPGGTVAYTAYALDGVVGDAYDALADYHPRGDDVVKPFYWGDAEFVENRFADLFEDLEFDRGEVHMHGLSPTHMVEHTLDISGAIRTPFEQATDQDALYDEWVDVASDYFADNVYTIEYLLVRGTV